MFWHFRYFHLTFFICFFSHSLFNCSVCFVPGPGCIILCRCFCPSTIINHKWINISYYFWVHVYVLASHWSLTRWTVVKWHVMDDEWGLFCCVDSAYGLEMVITCMRMTARYLQVQLHAQVQHTFLHLSNFELDLELVLSSRRKIKTMS